MFDHSTIELGSMIGKKISAIVFVKFEWKFLIKSWKKRQKSRIFLKYEDKNNFQLWNEIIFWNNKDLK